ncbi:signal peptidase II [Urinicoccus timonensis]|uniref:signal peptidase II n=1 Tax=Urinicoccus timonensis TaxID=2024205 RepID=UPI000C076B07|nr:signal peptidase II [Urinicoccus timonensis]
MTFLLVLLLTLLDQFSKLLVVKYLVSRDLVLVPGFFKLMYLENSGAAFGILQNKFLLFLIITLVVVVAILYNLPKLKKFSLPYWSLVLILAGTFGNFIDRVRLGYVVDFISLKFKSYHFAVFNLADTMIVVGSILLCFTILKSDGKGNSWKK